MGPDLVEQLLLHSSLTPCWPGEGASGHGAHATSHKLARRQAGGACHRAHHVAVLAS